MQLPLVIRRVLYNFQYMKYVRQLPFYLVRTYGKKKRYKASQIDRIIKKYRFNQRYSPIGYALLCNHTEYEKHSAKYAPCPTYNEIRKKVAASFLKGNTDFGVHALMKASMFKVYGNAKNTAATDEYWTMMSQFKDSDL